MRSLIERTSIPTVLNARTADSRPAPGPLTRTSTERRPDSLALLAAVSDACCAAKGVPLRDPRKPSEPELDQASTFPIGSVNVTMVLLNVACTWQMPLGTDFFSFFLKAFFLAPFAADFAGAFAADFAGAFAIGYYVLPVAFFLFATVPRRGPLRVREFVCVRWPRTGKPRR